MYVGLLLGFIDIFTHKNAQDVRQKLDREERLRRQRRALKREKENKVSKRKRSYVDWIGEENITETGYVYCYKEEENAYV